MLWALPLMLAGGALSAYGGLRQSRAQAGALEGSARAAELNAATAEVSAADAERRQRREDAMVFGAIRARTGAAGVRLEGSPLEVLAEAAESAERDALAIRRTGALQAGAFRAEAADARSGARETRRAGRLGLLSSLLTMGGQYARLRGG